MIDGEKRAGRPVAHLDGATDSFLLYGSYARGDYHLASDIDVLRITTTRGRAEHIDGRLTIHTYDVKDLVLMAKQGSLFVLHLLREAKLLQDPRGLFSLLHAEYVAPASYVDDVKRKLRPASTLLDIKPSLFDRCPEAFMSVASFLCRTLLYAEHADRGEFSFSLRRLAEKDKVASVLCNIKNQYPSYSGFSRVREIVRATLYSGALHQEVSAIQNLRPKGLKDPLFESLLRRIEQGVRSAPYVIASADVRLIKAERLRA
jgi:hypothetical protein